MFHFLAHVLGMDNLAGGQYGFWSGFGSDLAEFGMLGALLGVLRKHNCHRRGCPRVGRHRIEGTDWVVCRHHHPTGGEMRAEDLQQMRDRQVH